MKSFRNWFAGLSKGAQVAIVSVAVILGFGTVGSFASPAPSAGSTSSGNVEAATTEKEPVVTTETVTETETVPYSKQRVETSSLNKGVTQVTTTGIDGVKTWTYTVTKSDGIEINRVLAKEEVTTPPVDEVTSVGTYVAPTPAPRVLSNCDPNYSGACVPIASDVDCGGGSGNGPAYVYGTVTVVGYDIYGLDRDGDGYGCE